MKKVVVPIFIPHLGCPNLCVFCNQKKIAGDYKIPSEKEIRELVLEYHESGGEDNREYEIAFYGGSFTAIEKELQEYFLNIAYKLKKEKLIGKIRFSTRPDAIDDQVLKRCKEYLVDAIELGVQSMDDQVLKLSKRGHSSSDVENASKLIRGYGFILGHQIMPGLYGDTLDTVLKTIERVAEISPDIVRIYPTIVIRETELETLFNEKKYLPFSLEDMVEIVSYAYLIFTSRKIKVIRMGLQAVDNFSHDKDLVGGPYHPAFGELVYSRVYLWMIIYSLEKNEKLKGLKGGVLNLTVNPKDLSKIKGQKNFNLKYIKEEFGLDINVHESEEMNRNEVIMENDSESVKMDFGEFGRMIETVIEDRGGFFVSKAFRNAGI